MPGHYHAVMGNFGDQLSGWATPERIKADKQAAQHMKEKMQLDKVKKKERKQKCKQVFNDKFAEVMKVPFAKELMKQQVLQQCGAMLEKQKDVIEQKAIAKHKVQLAKDYKAIVGIEAAELFEKWKDLWITDEAENFRRREMKMAKVRYGFIQFPPVPLADNGKGKGKSADDKGNDKGDAAPPLQ